MKKNRKSRNPLIKFRIAWLLLALLASAALLYFGSLLNPYDNASLQPDGQGRVAEALSYSKSVVEQCVESKRNGSSSACNDLVNLFNVYQSSLELHTLERIADSTLYRSKLSYWQYLLDGWTLVLIFLATCASFAFVYEANRAAGYVQDSLRNAKDSREAELQPYLNITDVTVQTGEPPLGGGEGWIDITFKNCGRTPARNFRNHRVEESPAPLFSQYVEMLNGIPVVHRIRGPGENSKCSPKGGEVLLNLLNTGEEGTVRCPIVTDISDRKIKQAYMRIEWRRRGRTVSLPRPEGYSIRGSIEFNNFFHASTTRRLRYELIDSIDNGKTFKILEDRKLSPDYP